MVPAACAVPDRQEKEEAVSGEKGQENDPDLGERELRLRLADAEEEGDEVSAKTKG